MYLVREETIKRFRDYHELEFLQCACRFTEECAANAQNNQELSKRILVKNLIAQMKKENPFVESNIFKSVENVNLDTVVAYKARGTRHHFLEEY